MVLEIDIGIEVKNRSNVGMDLKIFIQLLTLHQLL